MGWDRHYGFQLYQSDPSGNYSGWKATCIGNNSVVSGKLYQWYRLILFVTVPCCHSWVTHDQGDLLMVHCYSNTDCSSGSRVYWLIAQPLILCHNGWLWLGHFDPAFCSTSRLFLVWFTAMLFSLTIPSACSSETFGSTVTTSYMTTSTVTTLGDIMIILCIIIICTLLTYWNIFCCHISDYMYVCVCLYYTNMSEWNAIHKIKFPCISCIHR